MFLTRKLSLLGLCGCVECVLLGGGERPRVLGEAARESTTAPRNSNSWRARRKNDQEDKGTGQRGKKKGQLSCTRSKPIVFYW